MFNKTSFIKPGSADRIKVAFLFMIIITGLISSAIVVYQRATPPAPPENLKVESFTDTAATLCWETSGEKRGPAEYYIYIDGRRAGYSTEVTYTAAGLSPSTTYRFHIRAVNAAGSISPPSATVTLTMAGDRADSSAQNNPSPAAESGPEEATVAAAASVSGPDPDMKSVPDHPDNSSYKVVGYYASWAAYQGFSPDQIDVRKLTHLNYAFANIGNDLKIALGYPDIDIANFNRLNDLKKGHPHLKTLISVGGWTWSNRFSDVALTDSSRTAFAESCLQFILDYGFDGIDLDWEYPVAGGLPANACRPQDKHNFTLLLQKIRETLDARSAVDGREYLLTIAGGSGIWYTGNTELNMLHRYLDFAQIMTYDIHAYWDSCTDFNAPLYDNTDQSPQKKWSVDQAVRAWEDAGFPLHKLVLGIPFYGYRYHPATNANNGLYQNFSQGSYITFKSIADGFLNAPDYVRHFHPKSKVPWLFNGSTFISYEDDESIRFKADYIKSRGLAGAMIWELSHDPDRVLLTSLYNALR